MSDNIDEDFRTVRGYQSPDSGSELSTAMEDYLEMIARLASTNSFARVNVLASALHVKPPSVSKMIAKLKSSGLVTLDQNGNIYMTADGKKVAEYLLYRHETIERFLLLIGSEHARKETELIEHYLSQKTVKELSRLTSILEKLEKDRLIL
ncbi:MAG: metal-dependent transcriptional regulator [Clostridiales bacterium]|nr:metal-dependent transcriptional regulator [Clostridiales bacterium]